MAIPSAPDFHRLEKTAGKDFKKIEKIAAKERHRFAEVILKQRMAAFERFPLLFTLLGTFGFVATLYGFEGIIDHVAVLKDNPIILLITGLATLAVTGTLYKKLGN